MAVKLVPKFNRADIRALIQKRVQGLENAVLMALHRAGTEFVAAARSVDTYKDQTANLRSSIGYIILKNGQQVEGHFPGDKAEGVSAGRKIADEVGQKYSKGYVLIGVAGMDYAAAVESKGYDVITGSTPQAEALLKKAMDRLSKKAGTL